MEEIKAVFKNVSPYQDDYMNLPVNNLDAALPFYKMIMGFTIQEKQELPYRSATLARDGIRIGLAENGGDPTQDGCFFTVDSIENALLEFQSAGLKVTSADIRTDKKGNEEWRVFFVIAPDGLCYCLGEKQHPDTGGND